MRDIKFRAWDHVDKVMLFADIYEMQDINGEWTAWEYPIDSPFNTGTPFDVMQFTGLQDKNGKEIYEGDIVKTTYPTFVSPHIEVVVYDRHFGFTPMQVPCDYDEAYLSPSNIELIGNIYENQDLLEK